MDTRLTLEERWELACSVGIECIQPEELKNLLDKKPNPVAYDGFEPSGRMHIAQVAPSYLQRFCDLHIYMLRAYSWRESPPVLIYTGRLQGVMKALNVNKLTRCGVIFKFW